jgi:hypothetical protein
MIMASFSTNNIGGLVFLQGILFGLSGSLIYLVRFLYTSLTGCLVEAKIQTAYTAPSHWFKKKRGLCTGIASCGGGLGGAAFAIVSPLDLQLLPYPPMFKILITQLSQRLLQEWGMAWSYRFFGLLLFVLGVVCPRYF